MFKTTHCEKHNRTIRFIRSKHCKDKAVSVFLYIQMRAQASTPANLYLKTKHNSDVIGKSSQKETRQRFFTIIIQEYATLLSYISEPWKLRARTSLILAADPMIEYHRLHLSSHPEWKLSIWTGTNMNDILSKQNILWSHCLLYILWSATGTDKTNLVS